ncbi:glycosyltransferase [Magnetovibrio sp.]|uniref:glycosyltransferase n=1 Tax=Magnetovibrio sp. TaxID=2024836 RepID=UPI002F95E028
MTEISKFKIAVVIPCYRVTDHIEGVVAEIGPAVDRIFCVDDHCPDQSGAYIEKNIADKRVMVIFHDHNQGVGGATITGYKAALEYGAHIVIKIDGDGQMNPREIGTLINPILDGNADYAKGNRFFRPEDLVGMPRLRLFGNAVLSFLAKFSTGYWNIFDPTNGYTAIHHHALRNINLDKVSRDYFFESDMLFRLRTIGAVTLDVPLMARYADEKSNLKIAKVIFPFLAKHGINLAKRIIYNYYIRDFSIASIQLPLGIALLIFGTVFGLSSWIHGAETGIPATPGTVMIAAFSAFAGFQLLLGFLNFDMQNVPNLPLQKLFRDRSERHN